MLPCRGEGCTREFKLELHRARHEAAAHGILTDTAKQRAAAKAQRASAHRKGKIRTAKKRLPALELLAKTTPGEVLAQMALAVQAIQKAYGDLEAENRILRRDLTKAHGKLAQVAGLAKRLDGERSA